MEPASQLCQWLVLGGGQLSGDWPPVSSLTIGPIWEAFGFRWLSGVSLNPPLAILAQADLPHLLFEYMASQLALLDAPSPAGALSPWSSSSGSQDLRGYYLAALVLLLVVSHGIAFLLGLRLARRPRAASYSELSPPREGPPKKQL